MEGRGSVEFCAGTDRPMILEVLTLGLPGEEGAVVLIAPDKEIPDGGWQF